MSAIRVQLNGKEREVPAGLSLLGLLENLGLEPRTDRGDGTTPGTVLEADARGGLLVATGDGAVAFGEAQPSGGRRMPTSEWIRGRPVVEGDRFE